MPEFLESYRRHECLWNPGDPDYSKNTARQRAYAAMVEDLGLEGLTIADVSTKIKTVRTRYGMELRKVKASERSGAGAGDIYRPRLIWFHDADAFLRPVTTPKQSTSNLEVSRFNEHFGVPYALPVYLHSIARDRDLA